MGSVAEAAASITSIRRSVSGAVPMFVRYSSYVRYVRSALGNAVGSKGTRISSGSGHGEVTSVVADRASWQSPIPTLAIDP